MKAADYQLARAYWLVTRAYRDLVEAADLLPDVGDLGRTDGVLVLADAYRAITRVANDINDELERRAD